MTERPASAKPNAKLDAALRRHLRAGFCFVNVGASDGVSNDPVYPFVLKYGWRGLLVEPVPHVFRRLRENYAALEGMAFENAIVSPSPRTLHYMPEDYCESRPWARQIGSTDPERVRWALAYIARTGVLEGAEIEHLDAIVSIDPPAYALDELLSRHGISRVDLLNLDTEGMDLEILEDADLDRYGVNAVMVETRPHYHDNAIATHLAARGFELAAKLDLFTDAFVRRRG